MTEITHNYRYDYLAALPQDVCENQDYDWGVAFVLTEDADDLRAGDVIVYDDVNPSGAGGVKIYRDNPASDYDITDETFIAACEDDSIEWRCVSGTYDPNGDCWTFREFCEMCEACFGDSPSIGFIDGRWCDTETGETVLENAGGTLTADLCCEVWTVTDAAGSRWWPDDEATIEIDTSDDPETTAVRICREQPMRGSWES